MTDTKQWWHKAVFYHIYPRSFCDSTNNGIGDLKGIINRLEYIKDLGVDAIWFSPFFPSPQKDFGYDITDYTAINPEYGTMKEFDELLEKAHDMDLKIILDIILNHTSDEHPWFLESKKNKTNNKHDWYVWLDGKGRKKHKPPTNWNAMIGGSAWQWSEEREQYYLHQFLSCQPDLNWRNPKVQEQMYNVLRFWLNKGVDGFRLDIIQTLFEDSEFRNNPFSFKLFPKQEYTSYLFQNPKYTIFQPETFDVCLKLREIVDSYQQVRMLVGEATGLPEKYKEFMGKNNEGLNLVFNFYFGERKFSSREYRIALTKTEKALNEPYWPCYVFSNHDNIRMISRLENNELKARLAALLLLTLRGTPFIYFGEEIGMYQVNIPREKRKDPIAFHKVWGLPIGNLFGRDGCRTPMQWNNNPINAGFSSNPNVEPWLPIGPESDKINVEAQINDGNSMLNFYKKLLQIRKQYIALQIGKLELLLKKDNNCLLYTRKYNNEQLIVILNFSKKEINTLIPFNNGKKIFSTQKLDLINSIQNIVTLLPFEGIIIKEN